MRLLLSESGAGWDCKLWLLTLQKRCLRGQKENGEGNPLRQLTCRAECWFILIKAQFLKNTWKKSLAPKIPLCMGDVMDGLTCSLEIHIIVSRKSSCVTNPPPGVQNRPLLRKKGGWGPRLLSLSREKEDKKPCRFLKLSFEGTNRVRNADSANPQ